ncbi:MAG: hypothetical protein RMK65_02815 [Anaerolineae bacterium]|nr:hypothetical protein [Anaerolineae bacterium]
MMQRQAQWVLIFLIGLLAAAIGWPVGRPAAAEVPVPSATSPADEQHLVYLPLVFKAPDACEPIPGVSYITLSVVEGYEPGKPPPERNPDYRLSLLGYYPVNEYRGLVYYAQSNDPNIPPQFTTLLEDQPTPPIVNTYQAHGWDWSDHRPIYPAPWTWPPVSVLGLRTAPKAIVRVPDSSYVPGTDCGDGGCDALVLYASRWEVTLRYAREDDLFPGYTVYIVGICAEPSLQTLYEQMNAQGRSKLPAVRGGQPIGRAWGSEIAIAIRDNGSFIDPRDCDSFWKGYCP